VEEVGASSAPLLSASFFIGARCKAYNDDFMQCKTESNGKGELECLKEGRKVTRCAASVLEDINKSCLDQFRLHWACLENNNQQLWQCRKLERSLNKCVFENLVGPFLLVHHSTPYFNVTLKAFTNIAGRNWRRLFLALQQTKYPSTKGRDKYMHIHTIHNRK
jgi:hypothetical protein